MEAKESTPGHDHKETSGHEDSKIQGKQQRKEKVKKGERKKKGKGGEENEEEKCASEMNTISLADLEAMKHKDKNKEKGKSISSILNTI